MLKESRYRNIYIQNVVYPWCLYVRIFGVPFYSFEMLVEYCRALGDTDVKETYRKEF
jgi:hypothetical protein